MSRERAKGTSFETEAERFLRGDIHKWPSAWRGTVASLEDIWQGAEMDLLHGVFPNVVRVGSRDWGIGDLANTWPCVVECKNQNAMKLAQWMNQVTSVATLTPGALPTVVHKRRGYNVVNAYATMPLWAWALLNQLARRHYEPVHAAGDDAA